MVKVRVELLLMHDANSKLFVTRQDIAVTLTEYPVLLLQMWEILKVNLQFSLKKLILCRLHSLQG
jgi:hypothetical protein